MAIIPAECAKRAIAADRGTTPAHLLREKDRAMSPAATKSDHQNKKIEVNIAVVSPPTRHNNRTDSGTDSYGSESIGTFGKRR